MTSGLKTIIYPVKDLTAAKAVYGPLLGVEPTMDQPYYVGYDVGDQHVGLDPNGHQQGLTGPISYWNVQDIEATVKGLLAAGAQQQQPVTDVGAGKLIATMTDPDGNVIGLMQPS
jgi:predicted enzyme related to lactoylglutathione lyase